MLKYVVSLLVVFAITLAECGCSDRPASRSADAETESLLRIIDGMKFVSTEKFETGLGEDGEVMGHWYLSFKGTTVTWDYSDYQQSGMFTIAPDGTISASMGSNEVTGSFDIKTRVLMWDDKQYEPAAKRDGA